MKRALSQQSLLLSVTLLLLSFLSGCSTDGSDNTLADFLADLFRSGIAAYLL